MTDTDKYVLILLLSNFLSIRLGPVLYMAIYWTNWRVGYGPGTRGERTGRDLVREVGAWRAKPVRVGPFIEAWRRYFKD